MGLLRATVRTLCGPGRTRGAAFCIASPIKRMLCPVRGRACGVRGQPSALRGRLGRAGDERGHHLARNRRGRSGTDRRCGVAYRGWRFLASPARLGAEEETPWLGCQRHADAGGRQRGPRRRRGI